LIDQIYDGLVRLDSNLKIIPSLAEYWVISEGGKKYTFYLRKRVKFHHGRELNSNDVKFSLERLIHKNTGALTAQYFIPFVVGALEYWEGKTNEVSGFKVVNSHVFEIQWKAPYVSGLYLLSMYFSKILPKDQVLSQGQRFFIKPVGTGPFKFAYWLRSPTLEIVGVRLERNEEYFGKKPYVEAMEFSPFFTLDHFVDQDIDIIPFISERLARMNCQVMIGGPSDVVLLGMSCHVSPLDRSNVRKAISLAIDRSALARTAYQTESLPQVNSHFIPDKFPGFFIQDKIETYNPEKARKLMQESFSVHENPLTLILFMKLPRTDVQNRFYRELEAQLNTMGIRLRSRYYNTYEEVRSSKEPYLVKIDWPLNFPDPESIIKPLFYSKSAFNTVNFSSPAFDDLVREADYEQSWTRRIELFRKMEQVLFENVPALPLFSNRQRMALQPYVRGVKTPALGFFHLDVRDIWLDK
jgi:ABC-type transport system substrate-binding protein